MKWLVTGGAGFIGSHFLAALQGSSVVSVDIAEPQLAHPFVTYVKQDIRDKAGLTALFLSEKPTHVIHFAAKTHVDESFLYPEEYFETNVIGTQNVVFAAEAAGVSRLHYISTDEVYGPSGDAPATPYSELAPTNPYAKSKAAADEFLLDFASHASFVFSLSRSTNTYGPAQSLSNFIPKAIVNMLHHQKVPVYGTGLQERRWLYVKDHVRALLQVIEKSEPGEISHISGQKSYSNLEVLEMLSKQLGGNVDIEHVDDRVVHDAAYWISKTRLGDVCEPLALKEGLAQTIAWYKRNDA